MPYLDFETERSDNESETYSVASDELIISIYYLCCSQRYYYSRFLSQQTENFGSFLTEHFLTPRISLLPPQIYRPADKPTKRALRTQISPGLKVGDLRQPSCSPKDCATVCT